jgi:dethiobiotin synthetase
VNCWFVTGTDTEIGKTFATCDLIRHCVARGERVAGLKPVASGCEVTTEGLRNEDALALAAASNVHLAYETINPYAFAPPIAPHLAAAAEGIMIDPARAARSLEACAADRVLVEGAGGWRIPIGSGRFLADLAGAFTRDVILVVGLRLGCINHASLSAEQILRDGFNLVGWIANRVDPRMLEPEGNLETLDAILPAPRIGTLPHVSGAPGGVVGDWRLP